jgi:hypothetical protein
MSRSRIFKACTKLLKRFPIAPCAVTAWTRHSPDADRYPSIEFLAALRTGDRLDVLAPQLFQYLLVALMSPLILSSGLNLFKFVAKTIFLVAHDFTAILLAAERFRGFPGEPAGT